MDRDLTAETLLDRARREGTPLIDGATATLVWYGQQAPQLIGDFNAWDEDRSPTLAQVAPQVWAHRLTLPPDAYVEYAYVRGPEHLPDPFNRRQTPNGVGSYNHYFYMPGAAPTPLARRRRGVHQGAVTRHAVPTDGMVAGASRTVFLYRPPAAAPAPLLVVFDGRDYMRRARLPTQVDNLIAQRRIRPLALALVNASRERELEYSCNEATVNFILRRVLPLARENLNLLDTEAFPGAYGLLGASLGGLSALYTALRAPQIFGRVLSQSGAFRFRSRDFVVADLVRDGPVLPLKIWMDAGRFERLISANQRMHALLTSRGYDVTYREYSGGHNYPSWRDDLWRGLETLFPDGERGSGGARERGRI
jgi:enterochelin esterase-like enzyme